MGVGLWTRVCFKIVYPGGFAGLPDSTKLALNLGLAAGLLGIDWLAYNAASLGLIPATPTGWSAPANGIELDTSLGYVKDPALVGGFYTDPVLRAFIARIGLGANPPKTVIISPLAPIS